MVSMCAALRSTPWKSSFFFFRVYIDKIRGGCRLKKILAGDALEFLQHGPVLDVFRTGDYKISA